MSRPVDNIFLWTEGIIYYLCMAVRCTEVVRFSEGPLLEVLLYINGNQYNCSTLVRLMVSHPSGALSMAFSCVCRVLLILCVLIFIVMLT